MFFASPPQPSLSSFALLRSREPQGLVPLEPGTAGYIRLVTLRISQFLENPSHTFAPL
jgi:hypothetical protein